MTTVEIKTTTAGDNKSLFERRQEEQTNRELHLPLALPPTEITTTTVMAPPRFEMDEDIPEAIVTSSPRSSSRSRRGSPKRSNFSSKSRRGKLNDLPPELTSDLHKLLDVVGGSGKDSCPVSPLGNSMNSNCSADNGDKKKENSGSDLLRAKVQAVMQNKQDELTKLSCMQILRKYSKSQIEIRKLKKQLAKQQAEAAHDSGNQDSADQEGSGNNSAGSSQRCRHSVEVGCQTNSIADEERIADLTRQLDRQTEQNREQSAQLQVSEALVEAKQLQIQRLEQQVQELQQRVEAFQQNHKMSASVATITTVTETSVSEDAVVAVDTGSSSSGEESIEVSRLDTLRRRRDQQALAVQRRVSSIRAAAEQPLLDDGPESDGEKPMTPLGGIPEARGAVDGAEAGAVVTKSELLAVQTEEVSTQSEAAVQTEVATEAPLLGTDSQATQTVEASPQEATVDRATAQRAVETVPLTARQEMERLRLELEAARMRIVKLEESGTQAVYRVQELQACLSHSEASNETLAQRLKLKVATIKQVSNELQEKKRQLAESRHSSSPTTSWQELMVQDAAKGWDSVASSLSMLGSKDRSRRKMSSAGMSSSYMSSMTETVYEEEEDGAQSAPFRLQTEGNAPTQKSTAQENDGDRSQQVVVDDAAGSTGDGQSSWGKVRISVLKNSTSRKDQQQQDEASTSSGWGLVNNFIAAQKEEEGIKRPPVKLPPKRSKWHSIVSMQLLQMG